MKFTIELEQRRRERDRKRETAIDTKRNRQRQRDKEASDAYKTNLTQPGIKSLVETKPNKLQRMDFRL